MARKKLGEILLAAGVIDQSRLRAALVEQRRWGGQLGRILVDMNIISEEVLVQALSRQLNFPAINLENRDIRPEVLDLVPGTLAEQWGLVPFHSEGKFLDVAMTDPTNMGIIDELRIRAQMNIRPYLCGPRMIERALARFYGRGKGAMAMSMSAGADPSVGSGSASGGVDVIDLAPTGTPAPRPVAMSAAQRRAVSMDFMQGTDTNPGVPAAGMAQTQIANLQDRIAKLESLVTRDEDVIRKLLALLVEKGVASREEILERIK